MADSYIGVCPLEMSIKENWNSYSKYDDYSQYMIQKKYIKWKHSYWLQQYSIYKNNMKIFISLVRADQINWTIQSFAQSQFGN